jgi:dTDP-4-amino-4,6-dideoxygalactose transaminase
MGSILTEFAPNERSVTLPFTLQLARSLTSRKSPQTIHLTSLLLESLSLTTLDHYASLWSHTARGSLYLLLKNLPVSASLRPYIAVQAFTCAVVILAIVAAGFTPLYIDITQEDCSMDPDDFHKKTKDRTPAAVILQHSFSIPPLSRNQIIEYCLAQHIPLIEDCAHGLVPGYNYKTPITLDHYLLLSFGRSKQFSCVFGGCILSNRAEIVTTLQKSAVHPLGAIMKCRCVLYASLAPILRDRHDQPLIRALHLLVRLARLFPQELSPQEKSGHFDMCSVRSFSLTAQLLLKRQLKDAKSTLLHRKIAVDVYRQMLPEHMHIARALSVSSRYPILALNEHARQTLVHKLHSHRILPGYWYTTPLAPLHDMRKVAPFDPSLVPQTLTVCRRILNLPTNVTQTQAREICRVILS